MTVQYSSIVIGIFLILTYHRTFAKFEYGPYPVRPDIPLLMEDYNSDSDEYNDLKFPEQNPNFLANWPYLKELLPTDYEGNTNRNQIIMKPPPYIELSSEMLPTPQPHKGYPPSSKLNEFKDREGKTRPQQKKNSNSRPHYMSACHFKICNLGRKRNVRFIKL